MVLDFLEKLDKVLLEDRFRKQAINAELDHLIFSHLETRCQKHDFWLVRDLMVCKVPLELVNCQLHRFVLLHLCINNNNCEALRERRFLE